jgi:hypothetical protein
MRTIVTGLVFVALAQSQPSFEVATIKVNKSGSRQVNFNLQPGGRFVATNVSLQVLISVAYGDGGPLPQNRLVISFAMATLHPCPDQNKGGTRCSPPHRNHGSRRADRLRRA